MMQKIMNALTYIFDITYFSKQIDLLFANEFKEFNVKETPATKDCFVEYILNCILKRNFNCEIFGELRIDEFKVMSTNINPFVIYTQLADCLDNTHLQHLRNKCVRTMVVGNNVFIVQRETFYL